MSGPTNPIHHLAHARLAAIVDSSDDAIISKDLRGIITSWNNSAARLLGYTAEEAVGQHISLIAPPGRAGEMADIVARIRTGERVEHFETQRLHKDGSIVELSLTVSPIHDESGQVVGASKIAREIGAHRRARQREALLAAIVSSSDDAIISKSLEGIITSWNPAAERLLGYTASEAVGRHISMIAPPGREGEMARIIERIRGGERVEHFDTQRRHKSGAVLDISLTVSPVYDEHGRVIGASKIARDIGERRRSEERLKLLMNELDHRAKNVLAVAQAILRLTRADSLPDFMSAVEGRIGALARIHTQVAENRWDGADILRLAPASLEAFGAREGRIRITGPSAWVSPTAAQVVGVLLHELATNAVKHGALSTPDGQVDLAWALAGSGDLRLSWAERGGPDVAVPSRRSFGTQVIERNVPDQLGGTADLKWLPHGLECDFVIPAKYVVALRPAPRREATAAL
jgi:PAS domain S-box-containing protein